MNLTEAVRSLRRRESFFRVTAVQYSNSIVWCGTEHTKGPGDATFEYTDGGHDHQEMS
jgi:hypothetical protein